MKRIKKKHSPKCLQAFNKETPDASYEDLCDHEITQEDGGKLSLKKEVQEALAQEQGYLCCYCMRSLIENNELKLRIEHFAPKSIYDGTNDTIDLRTDYKNLLAACTKARNEDGTEKKGEGHCDVHKGEKEFQFLANPSHKNFDAQYRSFRYNLNGKVFSNDENINGEIGGVVKNEDSFHLGVVNLNHLNLVSQRKGAWRTINRKFEKAANAKDWETKREKLFPLAQELWDKHKKLSKRKRYYPFCDMIVYLLEKKFKGLRNL